MKKTLFFIICSMCLFGGFGVSITHAEETLTDKIFPSVKDAQYKPLVIIEGVTDPNTTNLDFNTFVPRAYSTVISLAITMAVVMFVIGGFQYLASAGNMTNKKAGIDRMQNAVIGLLLIFSAYLILKTINPKLVEFNIGFSGVSDPTPANIEDYTNKDCGTTDELKDGQVYLVREVDCDTSDPESATTRLALTPYVGSLVQCESTAEKLREDPANEDKTIYCTEGSPQTSGTTSETTEPALPANIPIAGEPDTCDFILKKDKLFRASLPSGKVIRLTGMSCRDTAGKWITEQVTTAYDDTYTSCVNTYGEQSCQIK